METDKDRLNATTERIIGAAIDVHHELGRRACSIPRTRPVLRTN